MSVWRAGKFAALFAGLFLAFSVVAVDHADARRGGSFGSRGLRTFQPAPPTRTAPQPTAPVERSTTPRQTQPAAQARQPQTSRPGLFSGGSLMRGLFLGGLIGLFLGYGFGGLAGMLGLLFQALLIGGAIFLLIRLFRSQPQGQLSTAGGPPAFERGGGSGRNEDRVALPGAPRIGSRLGGNARASADIRLAQADLDAFERTLAEIQEAFGREDFAALRRLATPEMVSYLSEELADNAVKGVRNEVSDVRLLQADIAESWREGDADYATAAMRYASRDVTRDRATGRVVSGDPDNATETVEIWTFARERSGDWKLSAIQDAGT